MIRSPLITVMTQAARKAARALVRDFGEVENLQVSLKGPANFVSAADRRAEEILHAELSKARPTFGFLMEERGRIAGKDTSHVWIVDPLDGTTNFLHGIPLFAISIGLERDGTLVAGLVFNPITDETFVAERGKGAFLNDRRLRVAARRELADTVISCGLPHRGGRVDLDLLSQGADQGSAAGRRLASDRRRRARHGVGRSGALRWLLGTRTVTVGSCRRARDFARGWRFRHRYRRGRCCIGEGIGRGGQ